MWLAAQVANDCCVSWKLGVSTSQGSMGFPLWKHLGFPFGTKLGFSNKISRNGGMHSGRDLEIIDFVDVVEDENDLRWGRM